MGLFDLFKGKDKGGANAKANAAAKWADTIVDKRGQNYERMAAIEELSDMRSVEAAELLLKRFTFSTDPSITDQEEKEAAYGGILRVGRDVFPIVRTFAQKAESLGWPMRVMRSLMSEDEFVGEMLEWLAKWDTEYRKFIDPKLQLLAELEDHQHEKIAPGVTRFLEDVSDEARFSSVAAILAQKNEALVAPLLTMFPGEESVRVRSKILEGFLLNGWKIPAAELSKVQAVVPHGYSVDGQGTVRKG